MDRVILIRYGEIHLKGKNKRFFENKLIGNIKKKLEGIDYKFVYKRSRYVIENYDPKDEEEIVERLKKVFGIHSISIAECVPSELGAICETAKKDIRAERNFPRVGKQGGQDVSS